MKDACIQSSPASRARAAKPMKETVRISAGGLKIPSMPLAIQWNAEGSAVLSSLALMSAVRFLVSAPCRRAKKGRPFGRPLA
ncbi:hypothetical protein GCM10011335_47520 [Aureimonas glaciei]|uniref:Uncharacterized protein n=1 Tax=Aureimonas glaciei TaxID=1776957 RepID=A0A916YBT6_9HYPH|nr:hypothetical protein GCM10011335_47520 [Aureimonas glaciei]